MSRSDAPASPDRGAAMYITTTGIVLRETPYKESSRILTVLTAGEGKITVSAKGAKRKGSKIAATTQFLAFSEMTLSHNNGRWTLTEARSIELFAGLRDDLELLSLGAYFAEAVEALADEDTPDPELLSLILNALYVLSEKKRPQQLVKAAFEMRLMCIAGYGPELSVCSGCGREDVQEPELDLVNGILTCRACATGQTVHRAKLCPGSLAALRHIVQADNKKFLNFSLGEESGKHLAEACEAYMKMQLDYTFKTLDFYKSIQL